MESIPDINKSLPPEDYSLWEYPSYPLSGVQTLMKFDFTSPVPKDTILREKGRYGTANVYMYMYGIFIINIVFFLF